MLMNTGSSSIICSPIPPVSTQRTVNGQVRYTCWADAWISWVAARPAKPWWLPVLDPKNPATLAEGKRALFQQYKGWVNENGSFQTEGELGRFGIGLLFAAANMDVKLFKKSARTTASKMSALTGEFLLSKLRKGHVYAFFAGNAFAPVNTGHAVVIYGMAAKGRNFSLQVMDPWPNVGYVTRDLSYFTASQQVVIGWPGS